MDGANSDGRFAALAAFVEKECGRRLSAYRAQPRDAAEHFETENEVLSGGYAYRQLYELIQNAADAVIEAGDAFGRIEIRLSTNLLEVANTGASLDEDGIVALLNARSSPKRGNQIGRFGVGFKSLLKLGDRIDIVSRSIGLRFDPGVCRARIRRHLGLGEEALAPGMRLAEVLDPDCQPDLVSPDGRYRWAETVVSADISEPPVARRIEEEIRAFPGAFLLFLPADIELRFVVDDKVIRQVTKRIEGDVSVVSDGKTESRWRVFDAQVKVKDAEALSDATHVHRRDTVPLTWAVPLGGREEAGRFWAFFPTETPNLSAGYLNAPWKLNSDRTHLIRGAWNSALMVFAAQLVAKSLPALSTAEDVGAPLDAFPRRPDRQDVIAAPLVESLWDRIVDSRVLPDADCEMRRPAEIRRHFVENRELCTKWRALAGSETRALFAHPDCYLLQNRVARLNALCEEAKRRNLAVLPTVSAGKWLEPLADPRPNRAKRVLVFVGELMAGWRNRRIWNVPQVPLIPTADGKLVSPSRAIIVSGGQAPPGFVAVADEVVRDRDCRKILLDFLEVREFSVDSWRDHLVDALDAARNSVDDSKWDRFWRAFAMAPRSAAKSFIGSLGRGRDELRLRSRSGWWAARSMLVVVGRDEDVPDRFVLDKTYFAGLGLELPKSWLAKFPRGIEDHWRMPEESRAYRGWVDGPFERTCQREVGSTPRYLPDFEQRYGSTVFPAGWALLPHLPPDLRGALTHALIERVRRNPSITGRVVLFHPTRRDVYPEPSAPHPIWYWLTEHGWWILPIKAIRPDLVQVLADADIPGFDAIAVFFEMRDVETDLGPELVWPSETLDGSGYGRLWKYVFEYVETREQDFARLNGVWESAFSHGAVPARVPTVDGPLPLNEVFVTTDWHIGRGIDDGRIVCLSQASAAGWIESGAQALPVRTLRFRSRVAEPAGLLEVFPELAVSAGLETDLREICAVWVDGLEQIAGPLRQAQAVAVDPDGTIFLDRKRFSARSWSHGIELLVGRLAGHGVLQDEDSIEDLVDKILDRRSVEARRGVRGQADLPARLLQAVGSDAGALLATMDPPTLRALGDDVAPEEVAKLSLAVHGPAILSRLRDVLDAQGLNPPGRWGGEAARRFVMDLGFPLEFASTVSGRRSAEFAVSGPMKLPPLHDYQEEILQDVERLLASGVSRRRAVISLPTGGGKTRVAAEAMVRLVLCGKRWRSVLWVAQTDELCEQAVQCFRQLWVNVGTPGEDLRIVRLWGGQRNPPRSENDEAVVVVASIQTLTSRSGRRELRWVGNAGMIIIDECHHAIASSYTDLLRWLDIQVGTERSRDREPPLLGLSATPWRGYDEEESERLASRFDKRWFPADQEGLHLRLSRMGVISERSYRPLRHDRPVKLSEREQRYVRIFRELPESVIERIGKDEDRNELVLRAVLQSSANSILLFANSVAHAQYLAARLHLAGCPAAAVSGGTDRLARRHFTRKFRSGSLRVICNHSVLTSGFDAPKCDMIVVSRPVFSPVRYMQMVGRGLRGPRNGGTPHCEIVTVEDNILNYRDRLAYQFCKKYFDD